LTPQAFCYVFGINGGGGALTDVRVRTTGLAKVVTVAHYRTTNHKKMAKAGPGGRATIPYYISGATPGYKVRVTVSVSKGTRIGSCSTSFTPHR